VLLNAHHTNQIIMTLIIFMWGSIIYLFIYKVKKYMKLMNLLSNVN